MKKSVLHDNPGFILHGKLLRANNGKIDDTIFLMSKTVMFTCV